MKLRLTKVATAIALMIGACSLCTGCTQVSQTRMKSPAELFHNIAFGRKGLTTSEYVGSDVAREWAMAEHAQALAKQQQAAQPTAQYK